MFASVPNALEVDRSLRHWPLFELTELPPLSFRASTPRVWTNPSGANAHAPTPVVGARVLGRLTLEQLLDSGEGYSLYLADDEGRAELLLVLVADTEEALDKALASVGPERCRTPFESRFVAEVALNEDHIARWGDSLFAARPPEHAPVHSSTAPSASSSLDVRLAEGALFANRYRIEELLGRGGMGEVYRAHDPVLCRTVAIKLVRVDVLDDNDTRDAAKDRLLSEARVVCGLRHPNIVELFDASEIDGIPYLVLELCEGGNLRGVIAKNDANSADRLRWLTEIAEGLACAHASGIVHRDIKPENILLTANGVAKIGDFGIAKALGKHAAETFSIVGTPRYMAPEQFMGQKVDGRVDQFAWALVAQELYTGSHPRERETPNYSDVRSNSVPVPPVLAAIIARAMATEVRARFANFDALLKELRRGRSRSRVPFAMAQVAIAVGIVVGAATLTKTLTDRRAKVFIVSTSSSSTSAPSLGARTSPPTDKISNNPLIDTALRAFLNGSLDVALADLERITQQDDSNAEAHLLYALLSSDVYDLVHGHYRAAVKSRHLLPESLAAVLDAFEPAMQLPPAQRDAAHRLKDTCEKYSELTYCYFVAARLLLDASSSEEALLLFAKDGDAGAASPPVLRYLRARAFRGLNKSDLALQELEDCVRQNPLATECLDILSQMYANRGACTDAERVSRGLVKANPDNAEWYFDLIRALYANGAPEEALLTLAAQSVARTPPADARFLELQLQFEHHAITGKFSSALVDANALETLVKDNHHQSIHEFVLNRQAPLLLEMGRGAEAAEAADRFLKRIRGLQRDQTLDRSILAHAIKYEAGRISADEFSTYQRSWVIRNADLADGTQLWILAYALPAMTANDANHALAAADKLVPFPEEHAIRLSYNYGVGHVYLLANQPEVALPHLERAAKSCHAYFFPLEHTHAVADYGRALETLGRIPEACEAYMEVERRWPNVRYGLLSREIHARIGKLKCSRK
jgi:serine/threonine protein kinase